MLLRAEWTLPTLPRFKAQRSGFVFRGLQGICKFDAENMLADVFILCLNPNGKATVPNKYFLQVVYCELVVLIPSSF